MTWILALLGKKVFKKIGHVFVELKQFGEEIN